MLLGYISEVVKSSAEAERYLVDVFNQLQTSDVHDITSPGVNTFLYLQAMARKKLASFISSVEKCPDEKLIVKGNRFVNMMATDQQRVFCGVHYHGKSTANIAAEMNTSEAAVRKLLREAFITIRNNR